MLIFPFRKPREANVVPLSAALLRVARLGREMCSASDDIPDLDHAASIIVLA